MRFRQIYAPGALKRDMDVELAAVKCKAALVYLDDILTFFKMSKEIITHVKQDAHTTAKYWSFLESKTVPLPTRSIRFDT